MIQRVVAILLKDFAVGPRKSFFIWALIMPFALTFLFQVAFGSLFEPKPRLGLVDLGQSELTVRVQELEGFSVSLVDGTDRLIEQVEQHDFDAGLVLQANFDQAVRAGEKPALPFYMSGESHASNRIIIAVTAIELIRQLEGSPAPVEVETIYFGEPGLPLSIRLIPVIVFYALVMSGMWVPSASLVEEKERGTLSAMLVSPARLNEVLLAKWLMGFMFAIFLAVVTLLLNSAFGENFFDVLVVVIVAAGLTSMIGLVIGTYSRTATMLFTLIKSLGFFLFIPVVFYIFPEWPQWIARIFPLYWIISPIWEVSIMGRTLDTVWFELFIALVITLALVPLVGLLKKKAL